MATPLKTDPGRAAAYAPYVLAQVPRLLGMLDREPFSATFGSFDREHWSWKLRDFPVLMSQWAVYSLALLWRTELPGSHWCGSPQLLDWARAALRELCRRQHRNGAYDSVGPNTQDYGATLGSVYYLVETAIALGTALPKDEADWVRDCILRAVRFSDRTSEDYAFVSNHHALFALGLASGARWTEETELMERARGTVKQILDRQSPDGFYLEYGGCDPGYESLGIYYLARYWELTGDETVLASLERAVEFFSHMVHPDGSVGGNYGSRHTRLFFPGGFEILSSRLPNAAAVAVYLRERLERNNVVTPASVDAQNLFVLLCSYIHACGVDEKCLEPAPLPCETLQGVRQFESGLAVAAGKDYYAVVGLCKGGVCRIDIKSKEVVAYIDGGYVIRRANRVYGSQLLGLSRIEPVETKGVMETRARFGLVSQEQITPFRFVLLRILNLTAFRIVALGRWLRRLIVDRLITRRVLAPFELHRRVQFEDARVHFADKLTALGDRDVSETELARTFTPIHMGSARYFHDSELHATPMPDYSALAASLRASGQAKLSFTIEIQEGVARLVSTSSPDA